jgi:hypothetical protein
VRDALPVVGTEAFVGENPHDAAIVSSIRHVTRLHGARAADHFGEGMPCGGTFLPVQNGPDKSGFLAMLHSGGSTVATPSRCGRSMLAVIALCD